MMYKRIAVLATILLCAIATPGRAQIYVALSFDDPQTTGGPLWDWEQRNEALLAALRLNKLKSVLYVCGKRVDSPEGRQLLRSWDKEQHAIANHSWEHANFGAPEVSLADFGDDFLRCDSLIRSYRNYTRRYRFPYLKEGATRGKIDSCRRFLASAQYTNGAVSIDASDWYIDQVLRDTLKANPAAQTGAIHDFYIRHILERSYYYDSLATALTGRKVKHVLLLHHNLLNALYLGDLIAALRQRGFIFIDAKAAYRDEIYKQQPSTVPAGESIIWSMAKASGRFGKQLRYPGEDSSYEEEKLKQFLLEAAKK